MSADAAALSPLFFSGRRTSGGKRKRGLAAAGAGAGGMAGAGLGEVRAEQAGGSLSPAL